MKYCPACRRTFEGNLGFCPIDATPLVNVAPPSARPPVPLPPSASPYVPPSALGPPVQYPPHAPQYAPPSPAGPTRQSLLLPMLLGAVIALLAVGGYLLLSRPEPPPMVTIINRPVPTDRPAQPRPAATPPATTLPSVTVAPPPSQSASPSYTPSPTSASSTVQEQVSVEAWAKVRDPKDGYLNLRSGPSASTSILTRMYNDERVYVRRCQALVLYTASGRPGRWCVVDYNGTRGWAFAAYLIRL